MNSKRSWFCAALVLAVIALVVEQAVGETQYEYLAKRRAKQKASETKRGFQVVKGPFSKKKDKSREGDASETKNLRWQYVYHTRNVFSTDKLNGLLGYSLDREFGPKDKANRFNERTDTLIDMLAWTKDKDKKNAVLGMFSVDQLLHWNWLNLDECTSGGIDEQREQCTKVNPKEIGPPEDPKISKDIDRNQYKLTYNVGEPLEYLKYLNLYNYCIDGLKFKERKCLHYELGKADASFEFDAKVVKEFEGAVENHIVANVVGRKYDYNKVVKEALVETEQAKAEAVKTNCAKFVKELGHLLDATHIRHKKSKYEEYHKLCNAVVN